jgi:acetyl esterase/lipase
MKVKRMSTLASSILIAVLIVVSGAATSFAQAGGPGGGPGGEQGGGGPATWPTGTPPQPPPMDVSSYTKKWLDLPYATKSQKEMLDIYLPAEGTGPFNVIVYVHGGGWGVSDKRSAELEQALKQGLKHGYAVVSVNYRFSSEAKFPAQIYDVKAAIRWIRANGKNYNLKTEKIGAWGGSSGGHLVALLGTSGGVKELEGASLGNAQESSRVQAVIDVSGPINFLTMDKQLEEDGFTNFAKHSDPRGPESNLVGAGIETVPELVKAANPETYIQSDNPPFLLEYGAKDNSVSVHQATDFAALLEKAIGKEKVTLVIFPAGGHGGGAAADSEENINRIFSFLDRYVK